MQQEFLEDQYDPSVVINIKARKGKKRKQQSQRNSALTLKEIFPKTENQKLTFEAFDEGDHLFLHGFAGTGKSFIACYLGMSEVEATNDFEKLVIVRSIVPTRDIGFLPGKINEKDKPYELPYQSIFSELYNHKNAYELLKGKGKVEFVSTSFIRGITINNAVVVVDEAQNMDQSELNSIITRIGENCTIIFCGDFRQSDLHRNNERSGIQDFMKIIKNMNMFTFIEFEKEDIVRSKLVKEYIIQKAELGYV